MAATAARQFNKYLRLPVRLLSMFPLGQAYVLGDVFSFTGEQQNCRRTYKSFGERAGISRASVGRALRTGKANGLLKLDKNKGYVCTLDKSQVEKDGFLRVLDWVITEEFEVRKGVCRRLLPSERTAYSKLFTMSDNGRKRNKTCQISISELAAAVGLSERTIQRALWVLIRAGLIYRPKKDKGINAYKKSTYTLNYKLIRAHEKKVKAEKKEPAPEPESPKTFRDIEQAYKDKRERAELIAERNLNRARENKRFKLADDIYNSMVVEAAIALYDNPEKVKEFERRRERAKAERNIALRQLGMTEADVNPRYECKLCNDTGYLSNGARCRCFPRGAPPVNGKNGSVGEQNKKF